MLRSSLARLKALRASLAASYKRVEIRLRARFQSPLRVIVGSSGTRQRGWISTDIQHLDVTDPNDWHQLFGPHRVSVVLAEHVWEHLQPQEAEAAARLAYEWLAPGGHMRIAVPDGNNPNPEYIDEVRPGATGLGASYGHHVLYTVESLTRLLRGTGFLCLPLEYFTPDGVFAAVEWDSEDGHVRRSTHTSGSTSRSLIVDAQKPRL